MASKRRLRRKSCTGKKRYADKQQAHDDAWRMRRTIDNRYKVYKCKFCKGLHIGRMNKRRAQGMRDAILARK